MFCSQKITIIFAIVNVCGVKGFYCVTFAVLSLESNHERNIAVYSFIVYV